MKSTCFLVTMTLLLLFGCYISKSNKPYKSNTEKTISLLESKELPDIFIDTLTDWDILIKAIATVESTCDSTAYNPIGNCMGYLQLTPIYVKEANRLQNDFKYSLHHRKSKQHSIDMFNIVQSYYNPSQNINKAIKLHNSKGGTKYHNKVMREFKKIKNDL